MRRLIGKLLNHAATLTLYSVIALLLIALAWTALQLASIPRDSDHVHGTFEARRNSYKQTATAIAGDEHTSLRAAPRYLLMQHNETTDIPATATPPAHAQTEDRPAETALPDDFDLPKLLVPLDPDEGKWLAGTRVPTRVPPVIREHRLINVMFLGSDEELSDDNFIRTDTMIIVSLMSRPARQPC